MSKSNSEGMTQQEFIAENIVGRKVRIDDLCFDVKEAEVYQGKFLLLTPKKHPIFDTILVDSLYGTYRLKKGSTKSPHWQPGELRIF